jgi:ABC-type transporter Mla subunit MlaD
MTSERNALKAGIFMIVSVALIIAVVVTIKGVGRLTESSVLRSASFTLTDNIGGLRVGDDVRVGGLKVGVVKELNFESSGGPSGAPRIVVWFTVPTRVPLKQDTRMRIESTVTGSSNLNIEELGTGPALAADQMLVGAPSQLNTLLATVGNVAPELKGLVTEVRTTTIPKVNDTVVAFKETANHGTEFIKDLRSKLGPMQEKYNTLADAGAGALGAFRDVFGESKADLKGTFANVNAATGSLKEKLPDILDKVDTGVSKVQITLDGVNASLTDVQAVASNAKDVSSAARSIVAGNRGKIDSMIASLKTTGDNLKAASMEIRHSPWRLLYKPGAGEVQNLTLYDSARQFAEGASALSDAATSLRDALKDPDADPKQVKQLMEKLDRSFDHFNGVETELWNQVKP